MTRSGLSDPVRYTDLSGASLVFRPKNLNELSDLDDESLFSYLVASRDAGDRRAMSEAVYALVQARLPMVEAMVARSTPKHARDDLVEDILTDAVVSLSASFTGGHQGEFVNFIKTIASRRIADYTDKQKRRVKTEPLEPAGEDDWVPEPEGGTNDPAASAAIKDAVERVLDSKTEDQRKVIIMRLAGIPSKKVVEEIEGQSVANVDQIFSRFRKDLKKELDK